MVVLPGSSYVDLALSVHRERASGPVSVRNAVFQTPIILSGEDTHLTVDVTDHGTFVEYVFHEQVASGGVRPRSVARLEVHPQLSRSSDTEEVARGIESILASAPVVLDGQEFYKTHRDTGNRYGPHFQLLMSIWRDGEHALGEIVVPPRGKANEARSCRTLLIDVATQLLSAFTIERGQTFVLHSIDRIDLEDLHYPDRLWVSATRRPDADMHGAGSIGDVRIADSAGRTYLELHGVRLSFLARAGAAARPSAETLCVAATFTAEPLADSLNFWSDQFAMPIDLAWSPYNQIFQQLLNPGSAFHQNANGANVILLALEDWTGHRSPAMRLTSECARQCFGDRARHILPNGLDIVHLNQYETDYVYKEIFEDQSYTRHGIRLPDDATVIDIGANIGLFSLFVSSRCAGAKILAFEPAPVVFDLLRANCGAYGSNVRAFNLGVAAAPGVSTLTFYENSSVFSSFHADPAEDEAAIRAVVRNVLSADASVAPDEIDDSIDQLVTERLHARSAECRMTSVSEIIRQHGLATIDLLKIDAEKSELEILAGIDEEDWCRIRQIVVEVHDRTHERVRQVERLLVAHGFRCVVEQDPLLARSGLFNVYAIHDGRLPRQNVPGDSEPAPGRGNDLERHVDDFRDALQSFMRLSRVPLILAFCPASQSSRTDPALTAALDAAEERLTSEVAGIGQVHTIRSASLTRRYQLQEVVDPHSHRLGHVPYTPETYAAIGTSLFRVMFNLKQEPYKVIVLDCDNTLWKGVCGEDGPLGLEIAPPYRALQEFMVGQAKAGRLLCLCSKNNESDVLEVFAQRRDMALREEHFAARRLNWDSKSENLRSLSRELNLGLESFIFVDDNPVECTDVEVNCPGVLTLRLPANAANIPAFLDHVWAFDCAPSTDVDRDRTRMYRENVAREQSRAHLSLHDFIKGLDLRVAVEDATAGDLDRVSQLTLRTNQFNFTTIRRSEIEVREFLSGERAAGLVVRVSDRFGDYGLVGVVLFEDDADRYRVDTFLLSCRVLGKGVEHAVVAALARHAVAHGRPLVEFRLVATAKNGPALEFLRCLAHLRRSASAESWMFAAEDLAGLEYRPDQTRRHPAAVAAFSSPVATSSPRRPADMSAHMRRIGTDLCSIGSIARAIEDHRLRALPAASPGVSAGSALETALVAIWRRALGVARIGVNDNFFEVGGTSLIAVHVTAAVRKELKYDMSITDLFECPTVALLAAKIGSVAVPPGDTAPAGAARRGQQRRQRTMRRRTS